MMKGKDLAIILSVVLTALVGCAALAVILHRRREKAEYQAGFKEQANALTTGEKPPSVSSGFWGVTPVVGVGPNRTRTFLNGWWGLDKGTGAGWTRQHDNATTTATPGSPHRIGRRNTTRESHFSRASKQSRHGISGDDEDEADEFGMLEDGTRNETPLEEVDVFGSASQGSEQRRVVREK